MSGFEILNLVITGASEGGTFNWRFVLEHAVNLFILLGVLVYFLKTPVKSFLTERRNSIRNEIDEAQKQITEAKRKYEEYAEKLKGIEQEVSSLKDSIVKQGQTEREEMIKQAGIASENIKKEATETIALQANRAKQEIQSEVVAEALILAEGLIRKSLTESDQKKYIQEFTENIEGQKWDQSQH